MMESLKEMAKPMGVERLVIMVYSSASSERVKMAGFICKSFIPMVCITIP
jgi:hypothetical protein